MNSGASKKKSDWYSDFKKARKGVGFNGRRQPTSNEELDGLRKLVGQLIKELGDLKKSLRKQNKDTKLDFDPTKHLTKIQGNDYLEVKWRLVWMRSENPEWSIETEPVEINTDQKYVIFRATVRNEVGRVIATGTKAESKNGFADYLEKAETGAVGRALALCGYGTQFAPELKEADRIVDAPVKRNNHTK